MDFASGYVQRAVHTLPRQGTRPRGSSSRTTSTTRGRSGARASTTGCCAGRERGNCGSAPTFVGRRAPRPLTGGCRRRHRCSRTEVEALSHRSRPPSSRAASPAAQDGRSAVVQTSNTRRFRLATGALMALTLATTAAACGGDATATTAAGRRPRPRSPSRPSTSSATRTSSTSGTPPTTTSRSPEEGRHLGRRQGEPLHQARRRLRASPTSRRSRVTRCPRSWPSPTRSWTSPTPTRRPLAGLEGRRGDQRRRPDDRLRHRRRPRGHLLPRRPVREGRPADRPRRGRRADGHLGRLLRHRRGVREEGAGHRLVRLLRRPRPGDAQPGREPLRDRRQHRRRRQPRAQGGLRRP